MANFFRKGRSKMRFLPAVAGSSPTRAEITAGTDLSPKIASISGFGVQNARIPTPNLGEVFTPEIDGPDEVTGASALTFYDDDTTTTIRTTLAKGTVGFILMMPYGDIATKRCEVWPVKTTGVNDEPWSVGNDPARFVVGFAVTSTPTQNGVIPAI